MVDLNDKIPSLRQKILSEKKNQDDENNSSKLKLFNMNQIRHNPSENRKSSTKLKIHNIKDNTKQKVEDMNIKSTKLIEFSINESNDPKKEAYPKKETLKIDTEIKIPYYPSPTLFYKWEGQDGPLNNQLINEYYKSLYL